jgi:tetratricopeptide (TPR) repeat protein
MARDYRRFGVAILLLLSSFAGRLGAQSSAPPAADQQSSPDKQPATPKVKATDSVIVGAHLTPEEVEDGKINDAYQPLYHLNRQTDCPQIVSLCETRVIPMAEGSKFPETRDKFLFLANRDIAGCEMSAGKYAEAEQRYQKLFEYMQTWPGMNDSDYPQNFQAIGTARLMQGRWKDAEEPLEKSIQIFDKQIDEALHSDLEFVRNEHSKNLKMSEARARNLLGAAYFRDGRHADAMEMLEKAYREALESNATQGMIQQIIESGRAAAGQMGDVALKAKWDSRIAPASKGQP